jgi:hypothetical protein
VRLKTTPVLQAHLHKDGRVDNLKQCQHSSRQVAIHDLLRISTACGEAALNDCSHHIHKPCYLAFHHLRWLGASGPTSWQQRSGRLERSNMLAATECVAQRYCAAMQSCSSTPAHSRALAAVAIASCASDGWAVQGCSASEEESLCGQRRERGHVGPRRAITRVWPGAHLHLDGGVGGSAPRESGVALQSLVKGLAQELRHFVTLEAAKVWQALQLLL